MRPDASHPPDAQGQRLLLRLGAGNAVLAAWNAAVDRWADAGAFAVVAVALFLLHAVARRRT